MFGDMLLQFVPLPQFLQHTNKFTALAVCRRYSHFNYYLLFTISLLFTYVLCIFFSFAEKQTIGYSVCTNVQLIPENVSMNYISIKTVFGFFLLTILS